MERARFLYREAARRRRASRGAKVALYQARRTRGVADEAEFLRVWHEPCCSCGEPAGGVDRIDSSRPYETGNMQPLCTMCNYAKNKKPQAEFAYWRAQLVRHWLYQNNLKATPKE